MSRSRVATSLTGSRRRDDIAPASPRYHPGVISAATSRKQPRSGSPACTSTSALKRRPSHIVCHAVMRYAGQITVSANMTNTVNLVMAAPATAALTGAITAPSGFPSPTITLTQQLDTAGSLALWTGKTTTADATIPLVGAGKAALFATATLDNATTQFVHPALAAPTDVTFMLRPSLGADRAGQRRDRGHGIDPVHVVGRTSNGLRARSRDHRTRNRQGVLYPPHGVNHREDPRGSRAGAAARPELRLEGQRFRSQRQRRRRGHRHGTRIRDRE
jgi:hypothetical protein